MCIFNVFFHYKHHRNAIASAMVGDIWHFSSFVAANFTFPSLSLATIPHPKLLSLNTPASTFSFSMPTSGGHQFLTGCAAGAAALSILFALINSPVNSAAAKAISIRSNCFFWKTTWFLPCQIFQRVMPKNWEVKWSYYSRWFAPYQMLQDIALLLSIWK